MHRGLGKELTQRRKGVSLCLRLLTYFRFLNLQLGLLIKCGAELT